LYTRKQRAKADRFLARLDRVLRALPVDEAAIVRQEALALFFELTGQLAAAISHREKKSN
jgi:hypothetical protein